MKRKANQLPHAHWCFLELLICERIKSLACSHTLHQWPCWGLFSRQWTLGTTIYSLWDNNAEEAAFVCVRHSISLLRWPQIHTFTHSLSSIAWLAGSQTPVPILSDFTFRAVWPDGSWINNKYLSACVCVCVCIIWPYDDHHLTHPLIPELQKSFAGPPFLALHMVAICPGRDHTSLAAKLETVI